MQTSVKMRDIKCFSILNLKVCFLTFENLFTNLKKMLKLIHLS